jgi:uncharacterized membrane protein required for colicin V production
MNWLDIVFVLILLGSLATAFMKGFSRQAIGLAASVLALFCGIWFYGPAGSFLQPYVSSKDVANFCGFILVFIGILILGSLVGGLLARMLKWAGLSWFDRLLGAGFGLIQGVLVSVALITAIVAFAPGAKAGAPPRSVAQSRLAPYVIDAARLFSSAAPHGLKHEFQKHYEQLKQIWANAMKTGPRDLPRTEL